MTTAEHDHGELLQRAFVALDEMETKLRAAERAPHEPIAIIGMGVRFPGGVDDPDSFWDLLVSGRDAVTEVPRERWDVDAMFDPDPDAAGKTYSRWGGFIDDIDKFEAGFFGVSPREAISMDPQQRLLLEVAWHALEHAGVAPADLSGSSTGVFLGMTGTEYADLAMQGGIMADVDAYFASGVAQSVAAGRLAYVLDLHGPAVSIDTACSSSLLATHMACQSLRLRECDTALAGGVNIILSPTGHVMTSRARMASFEGRCKAFDASADGYVRGEGCGIVVLKRLSDAVAAGDRVLSVIRGSAANQDGRSNGLTAPNAAAQEAVIRSALADAGVEPSVVDVVECHGTGTTLGDPIEIRALQAVYGAGRSSSARLQVQSVKTNIGHLEAAAGIASLCKLVLALDHGALPTHLHLVEPNPYIPWRDIGVVPATGPAEWPGSSGSSASGSGASRFGGVSSFGFSGTNVHMVLEGGSSLGRATVTEPEPGAAGSTAERPHRVYAVSARTSATLDDLTAAHAALLTGLDHAAWGDAAGTSTTGRNHLAERIAVVAGSSADAALRLIEAGTGAASPDALRGTAGVDDGVVMLFTGQGSQVPGMGRRLYETEPAFRASLDRSSAVLRELSGLDLLGVMFDTGARPPGTSIHDTRFTQPALFAYEVAMAELWREWGVEPAVVLGHSIGEIAAAHIAGVMSLADALLVVDARGRLMQELPRDGGMAAVLGDADTVRDALVGRERDLSIAGYNGPRSIVVSGRSDALMRFSADLVARGLRVTALEVSHAFHSSLMDPMLDEFERVVASVTLREPAIELVCNRTGAVAEVGLLTSPRYWRDHVREAVRFEESILHAVHLGPRTFLEVGPAPTLSSMARGCAVPADARFIPSARRSDDEARELHRAVAALHVAGVAIDWRAYEAPLVRRRVTLPQYPFVRDRYWHPRVHRADASIGVVPVSGPAAGDSLLGHRVRSPLLVGHAFERELSPGAPSWLADHVVYDSVIVPAAAHLELLRLAARAAGGGAELDVVDVQIDEPLVLDGDTPSVVQTVLDDALREVTVYSAVADGWRRHARARLEVPPAHGAADRSFDDFDAVRARCTEAFDAADYYQALAQLGVDYGPAFRCILGGVRRDGEVLGTLLAPNHAEAAPAIHPALADGCLQLLGLAMAGAGDLSAASGDVYLPVGVERWRLVRDAVGTLTAHGRVRLSDAAASSGPSGEVEIGDLDLVDADGRLVAMFAGVRFKRASRAALAGPGRAAGDWFYAPHWEPVPIADTGHRATGRWVVVAGGGPVGGGLVGGGLVGAALRADGADVDEVAWVAGRLGAEVLRGPAPTGVVVDLAGRTTALDGTELADVADLVVRLADLPEAGSLTLLTGSAMAVVPGDRVTGHELATLWGIGRVAGAEHPNLRVRLVDVDRGASASAVVESVRAEVRADDREEPQVAWRDGVRYALRLSRPADLGALDVPEAGYELRITERGRLDGVALVHQEALAPGPGEVLIDVRASGLNFRDVLNVLGQYEGDASSLGSECAGVVLAVGEGVHRVQPGDRVMAIALASFATTCIAVQEVVAPVPDGMSAAEAATVPIAFLTAHYALDRLGGMGRGDRVLIHAAAGGVGMAAVQLAHRAGAEVFATAGSEVKRDVLRALGVRHVYDSRTFDFADQILRDTDGAGVDLVLNSLSGDSIAHSVEVLAPAGTFVEIGMAGIWSAERFHEERPAARYEVVFLGAVCAADPGLAAAMLDDLVGDLALGVLQPLPLVAFDIGHAVQAFRYMAQARQIGKVVVTSRPPWSRPAGGTWVVSGGLGGLGLEVAAELAQAGASRLVLFARSSPGDVAHAALERLRALGVDVRVHAVDVADRTAVDAVFADAVADGTPLRGVVHAAGVVDDGLLRSMTGARFESVLGPKVTGAANLAAAADRHHAEHVVLFAAGAGLFGATAQANYAAANAALDALAHARRAAGRPAQVLDWGPWSGVGMAAALDGAIRRWESQGIAAFDPLEGRAAFRIAVSSGRTQLAVLKLRWPALLHHYSKHGVPPIMSELVRTAQRRTVVADATPPGDLVGELVAVEPERRGDLLVQRLREQVLLVLGLEAGYPVGSRQGLTDLGMDSLMAVELSNRLSVLVDRSLPSTLAFEQPTLDDLAAHIRALLADRVDFPGSGAGTATSATSSGPSAPTGDDAALDDLTESELTDALLRELDATGY